MSAPAPVARCPFETEVMLLGDGELEFTRRIVVEAHLGLCASCAELEDAVSVVDELVAAVPTEYLGAAERALGRLPDTQPRLRPFALAAAAAVLMYVGVRAQHSPEDAAPPGIERQNIALASQPGPQDPDSRAPGPALPDPLYSGGVRDLEEAAAPLPALPAPLPPAGPDLRRRLAALDLLAADMPVRARELADAVRRRGPRGSRALAEIVEHEESLLPQALEVALHVKSPAVVTAVASRVDHPLYGDVAAHALAAGRDRAAVPALLRQLGGHGDRAPGAREALAEIGGRDAARALVERFWVAAPDARRDWLDAAVRADAALGGAACLEALGTPPDGDAERELVTAARDVVAVRSEQLLPYLRRTAQGRDALRSRLALRALGWSRDHASREMIADLARSPRTAGAATEALLDLGTSGSMEAAVAAARLGGTDGPAARAFDGRVAAESHLVSGALRGDDAERRFALALLARCGGESAAEALGSVSFPRALQSDLVVTLAAIGGDQAADALGPLAAVPGLESDVVNALGAAGSSRAVPWLVQIAAASPRRRSQIVEALARLDSPESVAALVEMLPDERAGSAALDALAGLPTRRVVPALLDHCGEQVPHSVRRALARIAGRDLGASPAPWREWWAART